MTEYAMTAAPYPGIPADLARQIAEERREIVEAMREARVHVELTWLHAPTDDVQYLLNRIDAILAREGGKHE
ncbi:MAG: hypothetical protein U1E51_16945 [Candidatus Binatia bacterium]|nr:hypothetical protein [Candidatus Binatia bacterium]